MSTTATCASSSASSESAATGHLARFRLDGAVGGFGAPAGLAVPRGAGVVLRTPRGLEIGEAIRPASRRHAAWGGDAPRGELLRLATAEDEALAARRAA